MRTAREAALLDLLVKQWRLLGFIALAGGLATFYWGRLVPEFRIAEQRELWGPLEPFALLREHLLVASVAQLVFGTGAIVASSVLPSRSWGSTLVIFLSVGAMLGSVAFGGICFLAAMHHGPTVARIDTISSALYVLGSVGFYLTCIFMALRCRGTDGGGLQIDKQPNYGVQPTVGAPSIRASAPQRRLRAACS